MYFAGFLVVHACTKNLSMVHEKSYTGSLTLYPPLSTPVKYFVFIRNERAIKRVLYFHLLSVLILWPNFYGNLMFKTFSNRRNKKNFKTFSPVTFELLISLRYIQIEKGVQSLCKNSMMSK